MTARELPNGELATIVRGASPMDTSVSLVAHDGKILSFEFAAADSAGQPAERVYRTTFVENSNRWTEIASAGTRVWDIDAERILYEDSSDAGITVHIQNRATAAVTNISGFSPSAIDPDAYLTPRGAMMVVRPRLAGPAGVYEWRDGSLLDLGYREATSLLVAGPWALWRSSVGLLRRDLNAGTTALIENSAGGDGEDVAATGDVAFSNTAHDIVRFRDGVATRLTADVDTALWNTFPRTDGINVIYRKTTRCCVDHRIALHDGTSEVLLTEPRGVDALPERDYRVNNGWAAYTKPVNGTVLQVFTRTPAGVERPVSSFGADSRIVALGPDGQVVFDSGRRRYVTKPPYSQAPVDIGNAWARLARFPRYSAVWLDGEWIVKLGRSAFRIN